MSGEGETQIEIERRLIKDKEAKINKDVAKELEHKEFTRKKRKASSGHVMP